MKKIVISILIIVLIVFIVAIPMMNKQKHTKDEDNKTQEVSEEELLKQDLIKLYEDNKLSFTEMNKLRDENAFAKKMMETYEKCNIPDDPSTWDYTLINAMHYYFSLYGHGQEVEPLKYLKINKIYIVLDGEELDKTKADLGAALIIFEIDNGNSINYFVQTKNGVKTLYYSEEQASEEFGINLDKMTFTPKKSYYSYKDKKVVLADEELYSKVNNEYKEFFDLYVFEDNIINKLALEKLQELREELEENKKRDAYNKKPSIGMTKSEVRATYWGSPTRTTTSTFEWGTVETWYYSGKGHVTFRDGIVDSVSEY